MSGHSNTPFVTSKQKEIWERELLANLKAHADELAETLELMSEDAYEDTVYRFYHNSIKIYWHAPERIQAMVDVLRRIAPNGTQLAPIFKEICRVGLEPIAFEPDYNNALGQQTRPFIEAFFHARYFLEMAVKYGAMLDEPPCLLPSGWAALLSLYQIR
jgi:hypothetical protein